MNLPRNFIATKGLFGALLFPAVLSWAGEVAGTVTHLSGPLLAKKQDGTVKVLAQQSSVEQGDTLVSEKNTYARIKFTDDSEITLRPNSQLKIDRFSFDEKKPEEDSAAFDLIKGGLRAITGILGKRNHERVTMKTPTATIGIRGTTYIAEYIPPSPASVAASYAFSSVAALDTGLTSSPYGPITDAPQGILPGTLPLQLAQNFSSPSISGVEGRAPGLYVQVLDGMINLSNSGGSQDFAAGQFGYAPNSTQPPVVLPKNPGIEFNPPAVMASAGGAGNGSDDSGDSDMVCEVR